MQFFNIITLATLGACAATPLHKRHCRAKTSPTTPSIPTPTLTIPTPSSTGVLPPGCASCPAGSTSDGSFTISGGVSGPNFGKYLCGTHLGSGIDMSYSMSWTDVLGSHDFSASGEVCFFTLIDGKLSLDYTPRIAGVETTFPAFADEVGAGIEMAPEGAEGKAALSCSIGQGFLKCDAGLTVPFTGVSAGGYISIQDGLQVSPYCF